MAHRERGVGPAATQDFDRGLVDEVRVDRLPDLAGVELIRLLTLVSRSAHVGSS